VIVLKGTLTLVVDGRPERIGADEVGFVPKGRKVVYRNDATVACDYWSVCVPAFLPKLAHIEAEPVVAQAPNHVSVETAHPGAKRLAKRMQRRAKSFLGALKLHGRELSIALVGDRAIRRLNRTWRKRDQPTDVLSFPAGEPPRGTPGPRPLGDVIISIDTGRRQAKEHGLTLEEEVDRYLAHGLLHLLGYDHVRKGDAEVMARMETALLGGAGMLAPLP
jgi:probable rRNA maturation factor